MKEIKVLVVGCGNMGASHAKAYNQLTGFKLAGLVSRTPKSRERLSKKLGGVPTFGDFNEAFNATQPDAISINTYPDTHASYVKAGLEMGAHVFVEKPLALTVEKAEELVALAKRANKSGLTRLKISMARGLRSAG